MEPTLLRWTDVLLLVGYAAALSLGQILFKAASGDLAGASGWTAFQRMLLSPTFLAAAVLYAALTVFWTWLLSRVPLSHAYPFVALCFVFVPAMAWAQFGERIGAGYVVGLLLIVAGLLVIGVTHAR